MIFFFKMLDGSAYFYQLHQSICNPFLRPCTSELRWPDLITFQLMRSTSLASWQFNWANTQLRDLSWIRLQGLELHTSGQSINILVFNFSNWLIFDRSNDKTMKSNLTVDWGYLSQIQFLAFMCWIHWDEWFVVELYVIFYIKIQQEVEICLVTRQQLWVAKCIGLTRCLIPGCPKGNLKFKTFFHISPNFTACCMTGVTHL